VHLIGYGPSQSTVGANRAGRAAATAVARWVSVVLFPFRDITGIRALLPRG
jgi:hypothetical protein